MEKGKKVANQKLPLQGAGGGALSLVVAELEGISSRLLLLPMP
jgi:hypothetical protein